MPADHAIQRWPAPVRGRSLTVAHGGLVYAVAYDPDAAPGITAQTANALNFLEARLAEAGSAKSGLLQVTIYLQDMRQKSEMDAVWTDWIGAPDNWPQRACMGADIGDGGTTLIEIVAIAARI
ncbi:Rid family hydrolase [uncultured Tateyamaria sp.]|uniref:Rid family hydrolase n=1 Tax=uncultured Tateyamaria sp. TaxID=455651 RepID=UPI00260DD991|nr:Rid family hydrolase [uncultured Tateyamaria sp.]